MASSTTAHCLGAALVVTAIGLTALGCGPLVTGAVAGAIASNDSGGSTPPANAAAKVATASVVGDTGGGTLDLQFLLQDAEADAVAVALRYTTDPNELATDLFADVASGAFLAAGSPVTSPLTSSAGGITYSFVWDTAADLGATLNQGNVRLQVVLDGEVAYTTNFFSVDNTQAPLVTAAAPIGLPAMAWAFSDGQFAERAIPVDLTVADADAQPVTIEASFSLDGGTTFAPAAGSFFQGTLEFTAGGTLATSAGGVGYTFRWASGLNGITSAGNVVLRFQATDSQTGAARDTSPFAVNNASLSALIDTPDAIQVDRADVEFILIDGVGGTLDVDVEFSVTGVAGPYYPATEALLPNSEGQLDLWGTPGGSEHVFVWNAFHDLTDSALPGAPIHATNQVAVRVRATRRATQVSSPYVATGLFSVDDRLIRTVFSEGDQFSAGALGTEVILPEIEDVGANSVGVTVATGETVAYVDRATGEFTVIGGGGADLDTGILAVDASLESVQAIAMDSQGNVFVSQNMWNAIGPGGSTGRVVRIDATTGVLTTLASSQYQWQAGLALDELNGVVYFLAANSSGDLTLRTVSVQSTSIWEHGFTVGGGGTVSVGSGQVALADVSLNDAADLALGPWADTLIYSDPTADQIVGINLSAGTLDFWGTAVGPDHVARVAGTGVKSLDDPGGAPTATDLRTPHGVAVDPAGRLLVVEDAGHRLWRFDTGTSEVLAGRKGSGGFFGDRGLAVDAQLWEPREVAVDAGGDLFIGDTGNQRVRWIDAGTGIIDTIVGGVPDVGDGVQATDAILEKPMGVAVDASGDLYVTSWDQARIRRVRASDGVIETYAGNGVFGEKDDPDPANAWLRPTGIVDVGGTLLFSQLTGVTDAGTLALTVRAVGGSGVTTVAKGDDGMAAPLAERSGEVLVGSYLTGPVGPGYIALLNTTSGTVTMGGTDVGPGEMTPMVAATGRVSGVAWSPSGDTFYYADSNAVVGVDRATLAVGTLSLPGSPAPQALLCDGSLLYYVDAAVNEIRALNLTGSPVLSHGATVPASGVATIAGTGVAGFSGDGGPATSAQLAFDNQPSVNMTLDAGGDLYFCDLGNNRVRVIHPNGVIRTVAGGGALDGDGQAAPVARLTRPTAIAAHPTRRRCYVMDQGRLRSPHASTLIVRTLAGRASTGFPGAKGPATKQSFRFDPDAAFAPIAGTLTLSSNVQATLQLGGSGDSLWLPAGSLVRLIHPNGFTLGATLLSTGVEIWPGSWEWVDFVSHLGLPVGSGTYRCLVEPVAGPRGVAVADVDVGGGQTTVVAAIADTLNHAVRIANLGPRDFSLAGGLGVLGIGEMTVVGGTVDVAVIGSVTTAIDTARLAYPTDVALTAAGVVVVTDTYNQQVHAVNLASSAQSVGGLTVTSGQFRTLSQRSGLPLSVDVTSNGDVYWSEARTAAGGSNSVYRLRSGAVTIVAGTANIGGIQVDDSAVIYMADPGRSLVVADDPTTGGAGGATSLRVAGVLDESQYPPVPDPGFSGDLGLGVNAQLNGPTDVAISEDGDVWILDTGNLKVRRCRRFP